MLSEFQTNFKIDHVEMSFVLMFLQKKKMPIINLINFFSEKKDIQKKTEKKTTNFEPSNDENNKKKAYLVTKITGIIGHISCVGKDYNETKFHSKKQSWEEV